MENKITSIVIHYKRPENVKYWIKGIRKQTISSKIIVWDNSGDYPKGSGEDVLITCSENIFCLGRVLISGMVKTEYIYNQDDDLAINNSNLFEKFVEHSKRYPNYVIGWNGRIFSEDINWEKAYQSPGKGFVDWIGYDNPLSIDMINFGVSFLPTKLINQVPLNPFVNGFTNEEYKYADDIIISSYLRYKRTMPFSLKEHYDWLNEYEERKAALSKQPPHMDIRNIVCQKLFKGKYCG